MDKFIQLRYDMHRIYMLFKNPQRHQAVLSIEFCRQNIVHRRFLYIAISFLLLPYVEK